MPAFHHAGGRSRESGADRVDDRVVRRGLSDDFPDGGSLLDRTWLAQRERCDLRVEVRAAFGDHLVGAAHRTERYPERTPRRVLEALSRGEHGTMTDDAG